MALTRVTGLAQSVGTPADGSGFCRRNPHVARQIRMNGNSTWFRPLSAYSSSLRSLERAAFLPSADAAGNRCLTGQAVI
jgi:hypothetical protein